MLQALREKKLGLCCQHKVYLGTSIVSFVSRHGLDVKEECEFNGNKTRHTINTVRNEKNKNTKRAIETTEGRFEKHLSGTRLWIRYGRRCSFANLNLQKTRKKYTNFKSAEKRARDVVDYKRSIAS